MQFHDPHKKNSTIIVQVMCAIVFWLFSLAWLYWFQADLLTVGQYVLSDGHTHYDRTIGALLITSALCLMQLVVARLTKLYHRTHALTYVPSMLVLLLIGNINPDIDKGYDVWGRLWLVIGVLVVWLFVCQIARQALPMDSSRDSSGVFSRRVWINMLIMTCMMLFVAAGSNSNAVFHYRTHVEASIIRGDYEEALRTGNRSLESDESLTMLRAYALSKQGQLAERLFEYPLVGSSVTLLPRWNREAKTYLLPQDTIYRHLGARPIAIKTMSRYFDLLEKDSLATRAVADYRLCALLIDRQLDRFAQMLPHYYSVDESLPKHYREALILYRHHRADPVITYSHAVTEEDWNNFQELERRYPDKSERKSKVADRYQGSYWYYYYYEN